MKKWIVGATLLASGFLSVSHAQGVPDNWPQRNIRIISSFPPGGQTDILARVIASALTPVLGKPVLVETKQGGGGTVGAVYVANAAPDGYTLLISNAGLLAIAGTANPGLPYNVEKDFAPVIVLGGGPTVLEVSAKLPVHSVKDLVALARQKPGGLNLAASALASVPGLLQEQFRLQNGVSWNLVSYKGAGTKMADLISGQVDLTFDNLSSSIEYIRGGQFRPLAISKHSPQLPDVKTFKEQGFDIDDALAWHGIVAPAGTPAPVVEKLNREISKILKRPEVVAKLGEIGLEVLGGTPQEFAGFIGSEKKRWAAILDNPAVKVVHAGK